MALEDWERNEYREEKPSKWKNYFKRVWMNKYTERENVIIRKASGYRRWAVIYPTKPYPFDTGYEWVKTKSFNNYNKALRFAKEFMKKHKYIDKNSPGHIFL